jgi:hypothetical protein
MACMGKSLTQLPASVVPPAVFDSKDFISTTAGNRVSRDSILCGTQNVKLHGKVDSFPPATHFKTLFVDSC